MRVSFARRNLSESGFEIKSIARNRSSARIVTDERRPLGTREVLVRIAAVVNAAWSAECRVALAKSWRECDHGLIKALAKGPVSD